jgi:hypothetical protein
VSCIVYNTRGGRNGNNHLEIRVRAVDGSGAPLSGARVDISVALNGSHLTNGSGATTDGNGEVVYTLNNAPNGTYVTTVTRLGNDTNPDTPQNSFNKGTDPVPTSCNNATGAAAELEHQRAVGRAARVLREYGPRWFELPDVVGHGIGLSDDRRPVIEVYLQRENSQARARIPAHVQNVPVRVIVTGPFRSLPGQCAIPDGER